MDEFRWIQMCLCLMLIIQIAGSEVSISVTEESIFMKVGDDVTLPCLNVIDDQNNCNGTTWLFGSRNKPSTVELIRLGQIGEEAKTQSDRLNVTATCSLVIKKLTVEDVGFYTCQQYRREEPTLVHQSQVHLSVISLTEHKDTDKVTLNCSVLTHGDCRHTVKWLIKGQPVDKDNKQIVTSQTGCSTTVSFLKSLYLYPSSYNIMKCAVTDADTGRVKLFTFSSQPSGNTETTKKPAIKPDSSTKSVPTNGPSNRQSTRSPPNATISNLSNTFILWFVAGTVVVVTLLIAVVFVIRWRKTKGNKTQMDENAGLSLNPPEAQSARQTSQDLVDPEVSYVTISYAKKTNSTIRVRGDDEGDTVTYSTVKAPSTSAAATTDPNSLYSNVTFPVT